MSIETIELFEDNITREDCLNKPRHYGARAVVMDGSYCVVLYQGKRDLYTLPGGQIEKGETSDEAIFREVLEETGYRVKVAKPKIRVIEYFSDSVWDNVFYYCEAVGNPIERSLTKEEQNALLQTKRLKPKELLDILQNYQSHDPYAEAIHRRELIGFLHSFSSKSNAL